MPGGRFESFAFDVSADGATIVGQQAIDGYDEAFIWASDTGVRLLADVLVEDYGLADSLAGWRVLSATGVSADGTTIVGWGKNPARNTEAWIAYVPEPSTCVLLLLGLAAVGVMRCLEFTINP